VLTSRRIGSIAVAANQESSRLPGCFSRLEPIAPMKLNVAGARAGAFGGELNMPMVD
jgi:hypothetical protein